MLQRMEADIGTQEELWSFDSRDRLRKVITFLGARTATGSKGTAIEVTRFYTRDPSVEL